MNNTFILVANLPKIISKIRKISKEIKNDLSHIIELQLSRIMLVFLISYAISTIFLFYIFLIIMKNEKNILRLFETLHKFNK